MSLTVIGPLRRPVPVLPARAAAGPPDVPRSPGYGPGDIFRRFLMNRSEDTMKAYRADVEAFAGWLGLEPDEAVGRLLGRGAGAANGLVLEWLDSMSALAPATRNRRLSALRSVVRVARRLGAVDWTLDVDSAKAQVLRDTAGPTAEDFRLLYEAAGSGVEGLRNRAIVLLAGHLALRRREIAAMLVSDFVRKSGRLLIRGKGGKNRWVGAPDEVLDALVCWLEFRPPLSEAMFCSLSPRTYGQPLTRKGVNVVVNAIGRRAGIRVWPHALRHAGITAALDMSGGDVRRVQQFARHSDPKTTMVYDDNRTDMAGQVAKLVAKKLAVR